MMTLNHLKTAQATANLHRILNQIAQWPGAGEGFSPQDDGGGDDGVGAALRAAECAQHHLEDLAGKLSQVNLARAQQVYHLAPT